MKRNTNGNPTAADLFAGAGGLSFGFESAGFETLFAVEKDAYSAETYSKNRNGAEVITADISEVNFTEILQRVGLKKGELDVLLAGPPCQGFSTSNMKTRNRDNPKNNLFREFLRAVREIEPKWILFENVAGILSFEKGEVVKLIEGELRGFGYSCIYGILNAADYGVPQLRRRFFLIGNRMGVDFSFPQPTHGEGRESYITVHDAVVDLPKLENGSQIDSLPYCSNGSERSEYQKGMRRYWWKKRCVNNRVSRNNELVLKRYKYIPQGGNWKDIPDRLMWNYKNKTNCHTGIYKRLSWNEPSIVISNFRKNMLIHPTQHRGLSVREAARLQSFPDHYIFLGKLGAQQQQVANAVPPLLARELALSIIGSLP